MLPDYDMRLTQKAVGYASRSVKIFASLHSDPKHRHRQVAMKNIEKLKATRSVLNQKFMMKSRRA